MVDAFGPVHGERSDDEAPDHLLFGPPDDWWPGIVDLDIPLVRSRDLVMVLACAHVFPSGADLSFRFATKDADVASSTLLGHQTDLDFFMEVDGVSATVHRSGGFAIGGMVELHAWCHPLPLSTAWLEVNWPSQSVEVGTPIPAKKLRDAESSSYRIW